MTEKTTRAASFCTLFLIAGIFPVTLAACAGGEKKQPQTIDDAQPNAGRTAQQVSATVEIPENAGTIYFAGGCFWGMEKLFQTIHGVIDAESGYANGREDIVPDYNTVCSGGTGYRETVKVIYDPDEGCGAPPRRQPHFRDKTGNAAFLFLRSGSEGL